MAIADLAYAQSPLRDNRYVGHTIWPHGSGSYLASRDEAGFRQAQSSRYQ